MHALPTGAVIWAQEDSSTSALAVSKEVCGGCSHRFHTELLVLDWVCSCKDARLRLGGMLALLHSGMPCCGKPGDGMFMPLGVWPHPQGLPRGWPSQLPGMSSGPGLPMPFSSASEVTAWREQ